MDRFYDHLKGMPDGTRMLYRSRHIYILFASLLNILLGTYFSWENQRWPRLIQGIGISLVGLASLLLVIAFFYEPPLASQLGSGFSRYGLYLLLAGTLVQAASRTLFKAKKV